MNERTQAVMERYRELGSNLEASCQVRDEFEQKGGLHWHRIHEKCWCGFLTVPSRFYEYDKGGRPITSQKVAEAAYLAEAHEPLAGLADDDNTQYVPTNNVTVAPDFVTKPLNNVTRDEIIVTKGVDSSLPRAKGSRKAQRGRPKRYTSPAERQRAYRERSK